jgi:hypothetical protein
VHVTILWSEFDVFDDDVEMKGENIFYLSKFYGKILYTTNLCLIYTKSKRNEKSLLEIQVVLYRLSWYHVKVK